MWGQIRSGRKENFGAAVHMAYLSGDEVPVTLIMMLYDVPSGTPKMRHFFSRPKTDPELSYFTANQKLKLNPDCRCDVGVLFLGPATPPRLNDRLMQVITATTEHPLIFWNP